MAGQKLSEKNGKKFDAKQYIEMILSEKNAWSVYVEDRLHVIFNELDVSPGMKLLDVGCGPTIGKVLAASRKFGYIVLSDIMEENLHEIEKFVEGSPDAPDWSPKAKSQAFREGYFLLERAAEGIIRRTRKAIQKIIPCNILCTNVLPEEHRDSFDVVMSNMCLESAANDKETYVRGVANLSNLVKPGGVLIISGACGSSGYFCGGTFLHNLSLDESTIRGALYKTGLLVTRWEIREVYPEEKLEVLKDFSYVLVAKKTV